MFKENMIAPCGLNCGICHETLRKENPCTGCLGPNETKSDYCANHCKISVCDIRQTLPDRFCDQCPQFPCSEMTDKEIWYANTYGVADGKFSPHTKRRYGKVPAIGSRTVGMHVRRNYLCSHRHLFRLRKGVYHQKTQRIAVPDRTATLCSIT